MERERLLQVLDHSACLTKRQIEGYLKHALFPEEIRVVELHLSKCPLCSDALDGLEQYEHQLGNTLNQLSIPVLPEITLPEKPKDTKPIEKQIVRTAASRSTFTARKETRKDSKKWGKSVGIAAALVLGFGALWYFKFNGSGDKVMIATTEDSATSTALVLNDNRSLAVNITEQQDDAVDTLQVVAQSVPKTDSTTKITLTQSAIAEAKTPADSTTETVVAAKVAEPKQEIEADIEKSTSDQPSVAAVAAKRESKFVEGEQNRNKASETRKEPPATRSQFRIGMEQYKNKEYEKAIGYFKQAEANTADPNHWEAVYYTGLCYKELGKKRKAIRQFKKVAEGNHKSLKAAATKQLEEL